MKHSTIIRGAWEGPSARRPIGSATYPPSGRLLWAASRELTLFALYGTIETVVHIPLREPRVRYAVLSDIHGNLTALRAVLGDIGPVDAVWCLGDVVGYGPDPNECVDLIRQCAAICLAGNHDWAAAAKVDLDAFNPDAAKAITWTRQQLTGDSLTFLAGLPSVPRQGQVTLAHGSPRDPIWEYILTARAAQENFASFDTPWCLVGHTHSPAVFRQGEGVVRQIAWAHGGSLPIDAGRFIINPGSVGQPRDGDPRSSYLFLDTAARTVQLKRVAYAVLETQTRMQKARLPARLITRLEFGR
jgi:diadenosine tetraphosphatase ApaH/serine/threonine PP2A family protein phosphatase